MTRQEDGRFGLEVDAETDKLMRRAAFASTEHRYDLTPTSTDAELIERLDRLIEKRRDFVSKRQAMNDARPDPMHGTPAERALYDERYKADHEAERTLFREALDFAAWAADANPLDVTCEPAAWMYEHPDEERPYLYRHRTDAFACPPHVETPLYPHPTADRLTSLSAQIEELRARFRRVVCHASGGSLDLDEHPEGLNDNSICVEISRHHNAVWEQAKAGSQKEIEELRAALEAIRERCARVSFGLGPDVWKIVETALGNRPVGPFVIGTKCSRCGTAAPVAFADQCNRPECEYRTTLGAQP